MKKNIYYEAVEKTSCGKGLSMLLSNSLHKAEGVRWTRFKTLEGAKREIEKSKEFRKRQYFYFRDSNNNLVDKISFYERYKVEYKIYKIIEEEEIVYETNNNDIKIRQPKEHTMEETPMI